MTKMTPAQAFRSLARYIDELDGGPSVHRDTKPVKFDHPTAKVPKAEPTPTVAAAGTDQPEITDYERQILTVLAQAGKPQSAAQVGLKGRVSHTSGSFVVAIAALRRDEFVVGKSSALQITNEGMRVLGPVPALPSGDELFAYWCEKMGAYCTKILTVLKHRHRQQRGAASSADIGEAAQVSHTSGSFVSAIAQLKRAELVVGTGAALELSDELKEAVDIRIAVFDRQSGRTVKVDREGIAR
jgi:hypothetical protein